MLGSTAMVRTLPTAGKSGASVSLLIGIILAMLMYFGSFCPFAHKLKISVILSYMFVQIYSSLKYRSGRKSIPNALPLDRADRAFSISSELKGSGSSYSICGYNVNIS